MKTLISISAVFLGLSLSASAQTLNQTRGQGYLFFAPGVTSGSGRLSGASVHIGGGGEGFVYKGLAVGAEIGGMGPWSASAEARRRGGLAEFSWYAFGVGVVRELIAKKARPLS